MASHINYLPDLCIENIFSHLPVRDLLEVSRVCTKWRWLQRTVAMKVSKLTLVVCCARPEFAPWHCLYFEWFDLKALIGLTVSLPNVSTLEVALRVSSIHQLCGVTILLRLWQDKLISFKLCVEFHQSFQIPVQVYAPLMVAINSLQFLECLSLAFENSHFSAPNRNTVQVDLPILAQLNRFYFYSGDETDVLFKSIRTSAVPNGALRLAFHNPTTWRHRHLVRYYLLGQQLCAQFDRTSEIELWPGFQLEQYCDNFSAITALQLIIPVVAQSPILSIFQCLSQLTQLSQLTLAMDFSFDDEEDNEEPLSVVPSVESLNLWVTDMFNHNDLSLLNIPMTMSNLQDISVYVAVTNIGIRRCGQCEFDEEEDGQLVTREELLHCLSHVMLPLTDCTPIDTISICINIDDDDEIVLDHLTVEDL